MERQVIHMELEALRSSLKRSEAKCPAQPQALLTDLDLQDILALNLSRAAQLAVNMGAHIVAQQEVPAPGTMGQTFDLLADEGVLTRELAQQLKKAVGFRNIAVHNYDAINWLMVHSIPRDHCLTSRTSPRRW